MWWTTPIASEESNAWTYEARTRLIFKCLLAIPLLVVALFVATVVIGVLPPIFFLVVAAWAMQVRVPRFRVGIYSSLFLGAACLYSPFGWGFTHHPAPGLNYLLSLGFFGFVSISGIRTMQALWQTSVWLRSPMLFIGAVLLTAILAFGSESLALQCTSSHYQWVRHRTIILFSLGILSGFGLLEYVRTITKTGCPPEDTEGVQDAGDAP